MTTTDPVWLEAAINGPWSRETQPGLPVTADEIVADALAAADEGAAILHFHPYDEETGRQRDTYEIYAPILERLRMRTDALLYGTLPIAGSRDAPIPMTAQERFGAVEKLARAGLVDWCVVDPGSTNITRLPDIPQGAEGFTYLNPDAHARHGLSLCAEYGMVPSYAIYEPGFLRLGAALHAAMPACPAPIYRFMFSDGLSFGVPPRAWALDAYLAHLGEVDSGARWMIAGLDVDLAPLMGQALAAGGHIRAGLEDAPLGTDRTNADLVRAAARVIAASGRPLATPADIRAA